MKDLVVKTALITLASIIAALIAVYVTLSVCSPLTLAELFDGTGGYSTSVHFYEKHYKKTGKIEDLAVLTLKINQDVDQALSEKYLEELVNHQDFTEFCKKEKGGELSNKQFYTGKYVLALFKNDKLDKGLQVAKGFVNDNGYTDYNPFTVLLLEYGKQLKASELDKIQAEIESLSQFADKTVSDINYIKDLKSKI